MGLTVERIFTEKDPKFDIRSKAGQIKAGISLMYAALKMIADDESGLDPRKIAATTLHDFDKILKGETEATIIPVHERRH